MRIWLQNPFDNLPSEGRRKQRYWLMAEAFAAAGHDVVLWTSDFSHATKRPRVMLFETDAANLSTPSHVGRASSPCDMEGISSQLPGRGRPGHRQMTLELPAFRSETDACISVRLVPTRPYAKNVSLARVRSHADYARAWERLAREETAKPDLIITSMPTISGAEAGMRLARAFGARLVVDVQDAWPETFERLAPRGLRWLAHLALFSLRRRAQHVYRAADLVTGVCERYRALVGRDDYQCAYLGIEPAVSALPREKHNGLALVYAGSLGVSYDLATVVEAVRADETLTLDVAGAGSFACDCPRMRFHGFLDRDALCSLFANCDVGVIPMRDDSWVGVPNKLFDYAAAGLRIVSSLRGETEALLTRHGLGVCYAAGDAADLARAAHAAAALPPKPLPDELSAPEIYRAYVEGVLKGLAR